MTKKKADPHSEIKRKSDLETIKDLFSLFPRPLVDRVLELAVDDYIQTDHITCLDGAEGIFRSTLFHLYDGKLWQILKDLFHNWGMAWYVGRTTHHDHLHRGVATLLLGDTDSSDLWKAHETYIGHVQHAQRAMTGLTKHLRENFPEFDLAASDQEAFRKYREMVKEVEKKIQKMWGEKEPVAEQATDDEEAEKMSSVTGEYLAKIDALKRLLNSRARGGNPSEEEYSRLRAELVAVQPLRDALPKVVLTCRTIQEFWQFIKSKFPTYNERTEFLRAEFGPLLDLLEQNVVPLSMPLSFAPPRPDVVLVTVNEHETKAVHDVFAAATGAEGKPVSLDERLYHDLGKYSGPHLQDQKLANLSYCFASSSGRPAR